MMMIIDDDDQVRSKAEKSQEREGEVQPVLVEVRIKVGDEVQPVPLHSNGKLSAAGASACLFLLCHVTPAAAGPSPTRRDNCILAFFCPANSNKLQLLLTFCLFSPTTN
eukprot:scaffold342_cov208-Ochromonas_danica.AAC.4